MHVRAVMNGGTMSRNGHWEIPGYRHGGELGAGASGRVVEALHEDSGTPVAIKYLTHGARTAFRAEARLLLGLRSPYVARLHEYVEHAEGAAIVMELVDGVSLRVLLRQAGPTGPEAALTVLKGSLLGLAAAHRAGVVHRDYKPENVLVSVDGCSKLVDFGIAVPSGDASDIAGTPPYMAPEQWTGQPVAPVTDVYAAAAVFFECLTGSKPYPGATAMELAVQHIEAPIPDDRVPEALRPLIRRGLAKQANERPPSADAFARELEALAITTYGEDWETRGQRRLAAALLALLPSLLVRPQSHVMSGSTEFADTTLASTRTTTANASATPSGRLRAQGGVVSRSKLTVVAVSAALLLTGAFTLSAITTDDHSKASATGSTPTSADTHDDAGASPSSPSMPGSQTSTGTGTTRPHSTASTASPAPGQSGTNTALPGSATAGVPSTSAATSTDPAPRPTPPAPPGIAPVPPPNTPPTLRVLAVSLSQFGCYGKFGTESVASVKSDGAAGGTLILTWFHSNTRGVGPTVATDRITIPAGQTAFSGRYAHTFGTSDPYPYWGVRVSSDPAAATGTGMYKVLFADDCNPIL
ncbi:serine/threonine-protein kinase [Streptomyces virginiae]|uniref:serine/threonine-protein kinase n=1 Tax=Streptomyces virginiae TaxID=1961 RepID=UPI00343F93C1